MPELKMISIRGAREHNLKNVDIDIPRDKLIVMTGLSGSGKSSLAFDTIYAEGQRRYVESLSAYARQFLEMMQKPDVDQIDGLSPAISIEQKTTSKNPRSTVGTVTEIYDYLRLLFARVGVPYSPATGLPIESQTVSQMVDRVMAQEEGTRLYLLAPMVRGRKGEFKKELAELQKKGFQRVRINGEFYDIADAPELDKKFKHDIDVVVDRIVVRGDIAARLADSLETALRLADGIAVAEFAEGLDDNGKPKQLLFSEKFACPVSGFTISEIEPRLFSFNNPFGACPKCDGLGSQNSIDPKLIVPHEGLTLKQGAVAPWAKSTSPYYAQTLEGLGREFGFKLTDVWSTLSFEAQYAILQGTGNTKIEFKYSDGLRAYKTTKTFEGVIPNLERRWKETDSAWMREEIERFMSATPCPACNGFRLKPEALAVKIAGQHVGQVTPAVDPQCADLVRGPAGEAQRQAERDRRPHLEGNTRPAALPQRCRPRLPHFVAFFRHSLRRRKPAHSPRLADRLRPHRRALRAGRTVDRPAPARQCASADHAETPARHRQHGDRRRA
jgi:excinuclease ABC subunit A